MRMILTGWFDNPTWRVRKNDTHVRVHHINCPAASLLHRMISYDETRWEGPYHIHSDATNDATERRSSLLPALFRGKSKGGSQVPRAAALMMIFAGILLSACGNSQASGPTPDVEATALQAATVTAIARWMERNRATVEVEDATAEALGPATPTPLPTPPPARLRETLMRHHQNLPHLLRKMREMLYGLEMAEESSLEPLWPEDGRTYRVCPELTETSPEWVRRRHEFAERAHWFVCVSAEEEEERKLQRSVRRRNYIADNTRSTTDWLRHVGTLCNWTMENQDIFKKVAPFDELNAACADRSPHYMGDNLNEATTFIPHFRRIARFFDLSFDQTVARNW